MLKKKIIVAIIMLIIVIPIIYFGGAIFSVFVGVIGVLAMKELIDLEQSHNKIPTLVIILSLICLLFLIFSDYQEFSIMYGLSYRGIALSIVTLLTPCLFYKKYQTNDALFIIGGVIMLSLALNAAILFRKFSLEKFIYIMSIPIFTDTFALFFGKLLGKHKLGKISPNKSWEGCIGGSVFAMLLSNLIYYYFVSSEINGYIILITFILSIIGQIGDLVFSKIKRENNIKDFSDIIPSHGGILDRIDSWIFVIITSIIFFTQI